MIALTRLDGDEVFVNADLIETVEHTPDTLVSLANGTKLFVLETPHQIVERVIEFKQAVLRGPQPPAREAA